MSRRFRFYEKKRGHRRTVPQRFGSMGEALFFGFFLCVGCGALWALLHLLIVPEWRANRQFVQTTCIVLDKRLGTEEGEGGAMYRPEISIEYQVDGHTYRSTTYNITGLYTANKSDAETILDRFDVGQQYPCWYDPIAPQRSVLVRRYSGWLYLALLIPISFIAISTRRLVGVWLNWGTSTERRAAMTKRAAEFDLFESGPGDLLPTVPAHANWTNSPGTRLAYRLPIDMTPGWTLFGMLAACLLWNGIASIFVIKAVRTHLDHQPDWLMTLFVLPLLIIGLALVYILFRQFWAMTGVGSTRMEISQLPLIPRDEYEVFVSQAGHLAMNSLRVFLVCDERATYRQGTDTRTDSRRVYEESLFARENFEIMPGLPFEGQFRFRVPAAAMHSFRSSHNEVCWKLLVRGDAESWREFERSFPVIVHPPRTSSDLP